MELEQLLTDLKITAIEPKTKTFLEIMKVSNKEVPIANILAYFFNPNNEHGLNNLFIKSLFNIPKYNLNEKIKETENKTQIDKISWVKVETEKKTSDNKRIDIFIETEDKLIAIEFKINHILNNPLKSYREYVEKLKDKKVGKYETYYFILTPFWKKPEQEYKENIENNFYQIILSDLIKEVKKDELSENLLNKKDSQSYFYKDFITTIENRRKFYEMIEKYKKYCNKKEKEEDNTNFKKLETLFDDLSSIKKELEKKAEELKKGLKDFQILPFSKNKLNSVLIKAHYKDKKKVGSIKIRLTLNNCFLEYWSVDNNKLKSEKIKCNLNLEKLKEEIQEVSKMK